MNMRKLTLLALAAAISIGIVSYCGRNPLAGNGTQTGNPVASMLYNPGGSPAKNAKVYFYPVNYNPHTGGLGKTAVTIDSTITDTNGNFVAMLNSGTYNVLASGDSGLAYQDSITVTKGDTVKPPADTLKPAGSIKGVVRLEERGDPTTVFILFMGTRTFTFPDDTSGSFTSDSMATGDYRVRILTTTPNYRTLDTTLRVIAGIQNVMSDTIWLKYTGIPTPRGLTAIYDTGHGIVTLRWNKSLSDTVAGYIVYRNPTSSSTPQRISGDTILTDTFYVDTIFHSLVDTNTYAYTYRIRIQSKSADLGSYSAAVNVLAVSPLLAATLPRMPIARYNFGASAIDNEIFVFCGVTDLADSVYSTQVLDLGTGQWTTKSQMPTYLYNARSVVINGAIYVLGQSVLGSNILEVYDPVNDSWTYKAPMPTPRRSYAVCGANGKIYVAGGSDTTSMANTLDVFEEYDPSTDTWSTKAAMPTKRESHVLCEVSDKLYVLGGMGRGSGMFTTIEEYDISFDSWQTIAGLTQLPQARISFSAAPFSNKIYSFGGSDFWEAIDGVEEFDPMAKTVITKSPLPTTKRTYTASVVVDSSIYVLGGGYSGVNLTLIEKYNPTVDTWTR